MNNTKIMIMNLLNSHETCFANLYANQNRLTIADVTPDDIKEQLWEDFQDKGFTKEEFDEIFKKEMTEYTLYKLGAYMIALFNRPETFSEWEKSIKEDAGYDISEEEAMKLWDFYHKIDI